MNTKANKKKVQPITSNFMTNVLTQEEILEKARVIENNLKSSTWRDLETHGKFDKNGKISFISDEMLIVGCDIGSETHFVRAIDARGRELSKEVFQFSNSREGFESAKHWMLELAAKSRKNQIVLGLEPTGHYWFALATWLISNGISVVQVNPYAVKQSKEIEDNSQLKDDRKDPKLIANLVKDGNYGMPYLPENVYADMRSLSRFRDQLTEDRIRCINRLHRELKICFPEYMDAFGKADGAFALTVLAEAPVPSDMIKLGSDGIKDIWHRAKLRGRGYNRASEIIRLAECSVGLKGGETAARNSIRWQVDEIMRLDEELQKIENDLHEKCRQIPHAENILEISGVGENILSGIIAEMGDVSRFDDAKEIQKLSGMGLVACSSGKHKGQTKISHRGRKRLRYWLFQAARSAVAHAPEFKKLHEYYTTRAKNPLKRMQSLIVIACKILRIIYTILKTGTRYSPDKMLSDIRYPSVTQAAA